MKNYTRHSFLLIVFLVACSQQVTRYNTICPEPPKPECRPAQWRGTIIDTTSPLPSKTAGFYRKIESVIGINSPEDEWAVGFLNSNKALLTASNKNSRQRLYSVQFSAPEIAKIEKLLETPANVSSIGALTQKAGRFLLSAVSSDAVLGDADIFSAKYSDNRITDIEKLKNVNSELDWDSQPVLSSDGSVMFFASERAGGFGGADIWFCVRQSDGSWSTPHNCGAEINTPCDEITPFISSDGTKLLFSSAGHETIGGYDLFVSVLSQKFWLDFQPENAFGSAKNLGAPINTPFDELFPSSPAGIDTLLYYSSNQTPNSEISKQESGGFDIYIFHQLPRPILKDVAFSQESKIPTIEVNRNKAEKLNVPEREKMQEKPIAKIEQMIPETATIIGQVIDKKTKKPVDSADVTAREMPLQRVVDKTKTDASGNYSLTIPKGKDVEISAQQGDHFYDAIKIHLQPGDTTKTFQHDLVLPEELSLRINFPNDEFQNPYEFVLDSNAVATKQTWQETLDLLAENLTYYKTKLKKLILVGHTDDKASDEYNLQLGKRRAEFVVNELVRRGVPKSLLETKTAGKTQLIIRRAGEELETYRMRCRRVELIKIFK